MTKFTVDTHLFRELGELLVGRDSTAIVELIKNSYDADATVVTLFGEHLDRPGKGRIVITDDGIGMTVETFTQGFLRIASRVKEHGDRRSPIYKRRFTGAKGLGRLAAHKLARYMTVLSVPDPKVAGTHAGTIRATIDWARIEALESLDEVEASGAVSLRTETIDDTPGTEIELTNLRRKWTASERMRVIREIATFRPPEVLLSVPSSVHSHPLLFDFPLIRDVREARRDPGFEILLEGDFDVGEEYWWVVVQAADWILEVKSDSERRSIDYLITPTKNCMRNLPNAEQHRFHWGFPKLESIPSLTARILIREGAGGIKRSQRAWLVDNAGVKVYMESFRVLPYAEPGNDWLEIDQDNVRRTRGLRYLSETDIDASTLGNGDVDADAGLNLLSNQQYYGAVFLTRNTSPELQMLVNREGFIPNAAFMSLQRLVRVGIDLSVRARTYENQPQREARRQQRIERAVEKVDWTPRRLKIREAAEESARQAVTLAEQARSAAAVGRHNDALKLITSATTEIKRSSGFTSELATDRSIMQVLAGVGLQMSSFVHEMNSLLGMASAVEAAIGHLRDQLILDRQARRELAKLQRSVSDLRQAVERQASYLTDIISPDARRRRSRQQLAERFDATTRLVRRAAEKRHIVIENRIPSDLKSPPMYPAELMVVFSNLLTNSVKACRHNGRVRASARKNKNGAVTVRIENSGRRVRMRDAEKWFLPFKSTTVEADPVLGQGMGMGLPIARNILEEYGATIQFVAPRSGFATALEIVFS